MGDPRLEIVYTPVDPGQVDFEVTYPHGGTTYDVELDTECKTHEDLATEIQAAIHAVVPGTPFTVTLTSTGAFRIQSTPSNFTMAVSDHMQSFCGLDATYTNQNDITGSVPETRFQPTHPFPLQDPHWKFERRGVRSWHGRWEGQLLDTQPHLDLRVHFDYDDWATLKTFLGYAARGFRFSVFRNDDDSSLYNIDSGAVNLDGRSVCVLAMDPRELAQNWMGFQVRLRGWVDLLARVLEGY